MTYALASDWEFVARNAARLRSLHFEASDGVSDQVLEDIVTESGGLQSLRVRNDVNCLLMERMTPRIEVVPSRSLTTGHVSPLALSF